MHNNQCHAKGALGKRQLHTVKKWRRSDETAHGSRDTGKADDMDTMGKSHGKINTMIELEANGNSSDWLHTVFHGTYDVHMSITNN